MEFSGLLSSCEVKKTAVRKGSMYPKYSCTQVSFENN